MALRAAQRARANVERIMSAMHYFHLGLTSGAGTAKRTGFTAIRSALLASLLVAPLAQLAEQLTLNQRVGGSIPSRRTVSAGHRPASGGPPHVEGRHTLYDPSIQGPLVLEQLRLRDGKGTFS
jgi:hypothetical protein